MSAFVVGQVHIDALVQLTLEGPAGLAVGAGSWDRPFRFWLDGVGREVESNGADALGQMLVDECVLSVSYRYPNDKPGNLPGPVGKWAYYTQPYTYTRHRRRPSVVEGLKALDCYAYQSCEHPGWEASAAWAFCDALRHRLIGALPGYSDADGWEWTAEDAGGQEFRPAASKHPPRAPARPRGGV